MDLNSFIIVSFGIAILWKLATALFRYLQFKIDLSKYGLAEIDQMNGLEFEHYAAALLRAKGYSGVEVTQGSSDFGVDITAKKEGIKYAIQCKRYEGKLSRNAVSDAVAGKDHYKCDGAMVFTNSYLSKKATEFAKSVKCEVIDRDILSRWVAQLGPIEVQHDGFSDSTNEAMSGVRRRVFRKTRRDESSIGQRIDEVVNRRPQSSQALFREPNKISKPAAAETALPKDPPAIAEPSALPELGKQQGRAQAVEIIKSHAAKEYPDDYSMQLHLVEEGIEAFEKLSVLQRMHGGDQQLSCVFRHALAEYPDDYSMQLHLVEEGITACQELERKRHAHGTADTFKKALHHARAEYPDDYSMQLFMVEDQLEASGKLASL